MNTLLAGKGRRGQSDEGPGADCHLDDNIRSIVKILPFHGRLSSWSDPLGLDRWCGLD